MNRTEIEWADYTWNPVTGCLHECEYCYAKRIARRFDGRGYITTNIPDDRIVDLSQPVHRKDKSGNTRVAPYPYGFCPTFHRYRLTEPADVKKAATIFVVSMGDLFGEWVPDEWIKTVFAACEAAPQHNYLFLTKNGQRYEQLGLLPDRANFWYGTTRTGANTGLECGASDHRNTFLSIEPLLAPLQSSTIEAIEYWSWIIIGAETGNRKGKATPDKRWIDEIVSKCKDSETPIFMKDSLEAIVGSENMLRQLPEGLELKPKGGRRRE